MDRSVLAGLIVLPPLYATAIILPLFPSDAFGVWIGAGLTIAIGIVSVSSNKLVQEIAAILLIALAFLALGGLAGSGALGGFGVQVADGALIGLPFVVSAYVWRYGEPLVNRIIAFQVTLLLTLMLLATRSTLLNGGIAVTGPSFVGAFLAVNVDQVEALGALVQGFSYPSLPLSQFSDPVFLATAVLAFGGLLLVVVRPQTGRETDLPTTPVFLPESFTLPSPADRLLSYSQYDLLEARSRPSGPPDRWLPGVTPLLAAAVVTGAGLTLAFLVPSIFLLTSTLVVVAFLIGLGRLVSPARAYAMGRGLAEAPGGSGKAPDSRPTETELEAHPAATSSVDRS